MPVAPLRGVAWACVVLFSLALSSNGAQAEPLQLVVASASAGTDDRQIGRVVLIIRLADDSQRPFANFTQTHVGQMMDMRIDGKSVLKSVLREPISGGGLQITIDNIEEARRLATRLSDLTTKLEVEAVSN
jgi:preprotein translocase subunit SecD